jgi:chorismate synthase
VSPNSYGSLFKITSFGESHGTAIGAVLEGCPSGVVFKEEILADFIQRRRPGASILTSQRNEEDKVEVLSGIFEEKTLGTPIALVAKNKDQKSGEYDFLKEPSASRRGHADDMWKEKFSHVDYRGGGRSSGRETLSRVMGGAVAKMFCTQLYPELKVQASLLQVGPLNAQKKNFSQDLKRLLMEAKEKGESFGGIAALNISHTPASLGEPVFMKLKSELAKAMMSVGAVLGVEFANAFEDCLLPGTEFHKAPTEIYGGIRGGVSTGENICVRIAVKPTSSITDVAKQGRHDPCILLRALVVFEAMAWLSLADLILYRRLNNL